jgi:hypothetical protein
MCRYSNRGETLARLRRCQVLTTDLAADMLGSATPCEQRRVHKLTSRLAASEIEELLAAYQSGQTAKDLAALHGIAKSTVLRLLHERGVAVRSRGFRSAPVPPDRCADARLL